MQRVEYVQAFEQRSTRCFGPLQSQKQCAPRATGTRLAGFFNALLSLELGFIQPGIYPAPAYELFMAPLFDNATSIDHHNTIHVMEGRQPMRNDKGRPALCQ